MNEDLSMPLERESMFSDVYDELRTLARRQIGPGDTLNPTALVHELFLRFSNHLLPEFSDQKQFFSYAARAMRHLLIDRARHRQASKTGGALRHIELGAATDLSTSDEIDALALDAALKQLELEDKRAAQVTELYYFAGLKLEQIGELLDLTRRTIDRDLAFARAFLRTRMTI